MTKINITWDQILTIWLWVAGILIAVGLVWLIAKPGVPCTESLDYYPNLPDHGNFGQPILTEHNCSPGETPTNWRQFAPNKE